MRASAAPGTSYRLRSPRHEAGPRQPRDGGGGEHARVVRRRGVHRARERDAVPARHPGGRAGRREGPVGGVNDVVAAQPRREPRVVGREVGAIGDVREKREARAAEQRRMHPVADVRPQRVGRLPFAQKVHREIDVLAGGGRGRRQPLPGLDVTACRRAPVKVDEHADPQARGPLRDREARRGDLPLLSGVSPSCAASSRSWRCACRSAIAHETIAGAPTTSSRPRLITPSASATGAGTPNAAPTATRAPS